MESIKYLYRIGNGPSSSHTMGPKSAAEIFSKKNTNADSFKVYLYGSLALTGKGHMTDYIIEKTLPKPTEIFWKPEEELPLHPNGMIFEAYFADKKIDEWEVYSVGGGEIIDKNTGKDERDIYPETTMADIISHLEKNGGTLWEYVLKVEGETILDYMKEVWEVMKSAIYRGLETDGTLPGVLNLRRKAPSYHVKAKMQNKFAEDDTFLFAYALAVSEENAAAGRVVTAPTCGSSGILPAVMYLFYKKYEFSETRILKALLVAGLVGNLIKENASISGAEVGCQGEVGTACAMAAAACAQLLGGTMYQIEYAASSGLEHHLGLTCDPIAGLVQVPCIERNAFGAQRALDSALYAIHSDGRHMVPFDNVVEVMEQTGHDLPSLYRETSKGGLATMGLHGRPKKE
ncbi:MAG: L-serine ammonia-lyase [Bacteroidales bacterium]|nr:L-serine ammonia-lyase [Bacteroidales bacterium]MBN2758578.1 L-serine ammonia-lyase [Bacteroidales bacterium]